MKKINVPFEIKDLGAKFLTSDIWFTLHDKKYKRVLRPQRYSKISRGERLREAENELRKLLFQNYQPENRPVLNYSDSVTSSFGVEVISLEEFDQVGEKVKFNFQMKFTWYDEFLRWNRSDYDLLYLNQ